MSTPQAPPQQPMQAGATETAGFGTQALAVSAEVATSAVVAQAQAAVQARYIVAFQRPRSWDRVRQNLLRDCQRPNFAKGARYAVPRGDKTIRGPSIRFVEAALRAMTNVCIDQTVKSDDPQRRIVTVTVTDLEANLTYPREVVIEKTVERKSYQGDMSQVRRRKNSYGETIYIVPATDGEVAQKEAAAVSKAIRTCGERLIPGDLVDECMEVVVETVGNQTAEDPDAERKRIVDAFTRLNVPADQLSAYLGHDLGEASEAELAYLREVYVTIDQGEASWPELVKLRAAELGEGAAAKKARAKRTQLVEAAEKKRLAGQAEAASDEPEQAEQQA